MRTNKLYKMLHNPFKNAYARVGIAILSVVIIVLFIPDGSGYSYAPEINKPWSYGQVIAPYDFPIYKSDEVLRNERDSMMSQYQPYFNIDETVQKRNIDSLRAAFYSGRMEGVPVSYLSHLTRLLQAVYSRGVMADEALGKLRDTETNSIRVVQGNEASATPVKVIFTGRTAYLYMMTEDSATLQRDILQRCNLNAYIEPNLTYDAEKSEAIIKDLMSSVAPSTGMVLSGQKIIDRGELVDEHTYNALLSLQKESERREKPMHERVLEFAGKFMLVSILVALMMIYIQLYRIDYYHKGGAILLVFCMVVLFPILTSTMVEHKWFSIYIIPFAMVAVFIRIFMDARTAFLTYIIMILLASLSLRDPYRFVIFETIMGLTAIYSLSELTQRSQILRTALIVTIVGCVFGVAEALMQGVSPENFDTRWFIHVVTQGIFLLFVYPLMFLLEKVFGFTSAVTLVELSNTNNPLLRKMSVVAQGSFNHSMQVANLAAEVANRIGAKVQLVRTGAMYHDIGKMSNPAFFTENQSGVNPHDSLSEVESAQIIIGHVTEGLKLADKYSLPREIKHFISTHHGKGKVKYFYIQHRNKFPDDPIDEEAFSYPGPNPYTREQAILMMADSVEACSRSLKSYDEESIVKLVNDIVDGQTTEGFFAQCPLTFKDINDAKEVLVESLKTIYHTRITYPDLKQPGTSATDTAPPPTKTTSRRWGLR